MRNNKCRMWVLTGLMCLTCLSVAAATFPDNVVLKDLNGNAVDFGSFRGKYVYVDIWASWCQPCRGEIPHLQALEKSLGRKDVTFVSISVDQDPAAWQKAAKEFNLEGNQLINSDAGLCKALNVRFIPRFMLVDPEGNIVNADAPRPSSVEEVKKMFDDCPAVKVKKGKKAKK